MGLPAPLAWLLPLTFAPSRSADLLKALTPKAAVQGREVFAGVRMCGCAGAACCRWTARPTVGWTG